MRSLGCLWTVWDIVLIVAIVGTMFGLAYIAKIYFPSDAPKQLTFTCNDSLIFNDDEHILNVTTRQWNNSDGYFIENIITTDKRTISCKSNVYSTMITIMRARGECGD